MVQLKEKSSAQLHKTEKPSSELLDQFWKLSDLSVDVRTKAVTFLEHNVDKCQREYVLKRLTNGLLSSRAASRIGFASALSKIVLPAEASPLLKQATLVYTNHTDQNEAQIATVFLCAAILKSAKCRTNADLIGEVTSVLWAIRAQAQHLAQFIALTVGDFLYSVRDESTAADLCSSVLKRIGNELDVVDEVFDVNLCYIRLQLLRALPNTAKQYIPTHKRLAKPKHLLAMLQTNKEHFMCVTTQQPHAALSLVLQMIAESKASLLSAVWTQALYPLTWAQHKAGALSAGCHLLCDIIQLCDKHGQSIEPLLDALTMGLLQMGWLGRTQLPFVQDSLLKVQQSLVQSVQNSPSTCVHVLNALNTHCATYDRCTRQRVIECCVRALPFAHAEEYLKQLHKSLVALGEAESNASELSILTKFDHVQWLCCTRRNHPSIESTTACARLQANAIACLVHLCTLKPNGKERVGDNNNNIKFESVSARAYLVLCACVHFVFELHTPRANQHSSPAQSQPITDELLHQLCQSTVHLVAQHLNGHTDDEHVQLYNRVRSCLLSVYKEQTALSRCVLCVLVPCTILTLVSHTPDEHLLDVIDDVFTVHASGDISELCSLLVSLMQRAEACLRSAVTAAFYYFCELDAFTFEHVQALIKLMDVRETVAARDWLHLESDTEEDIDTDQAQDTEQMDTKQGDDSDTDSDDDEGADQAMSPLHDVNPELVKAVRHALGDTIMDDDQSSVASSGVSDSVMFKHDQLLADAFRTFHRSAPAKTETEALSQLRTRTLPLCRLLLTHSHSQPTVVMQSLPFVLSAVHNAVRTAQAQQLFAQLYQLLDTVNKHKFTKVAPYSNGCVCVILFLMEQLQSVSTADFENVHKRLVASSKGIQNTDVAELAGRTLTTLMSWSQHNPLAVDALQTAQLSLMDDFFVQPNNVNEHLPAALILIPCQTLPEMLVKSVHPLVTVAFDRDISVVRPYHRTVSLQLLRTFIRKELINFEDKSLKHIWKKFLKSFQNGVVAVLQEVDAVSAEGADEDQTNSVSLKANYLRETMLLVQTVAKHFDKERMSIFAEHGALLTALSEASRWQRLNQVCQLRNQLNATKPHKILQTLVNKLDL